MQRTLVDEHRWIGHQRFLHALNYCMLLPGPEAQQLAVYIGWLLNGLRGGLVAGILFVLPGMVALLALSAIYVGLRRRHRRHGDLRRPGPGGARDRRPGRAPGRQPRPRPPRPGRPGRGRLPGPVPVRGAVPAGRGGRRRDRLAARPLGAPHPRRPGQGQPRRRRAAAADPRRRPAHRTAQPCPNLPRSSGSGCCSGRAPGCAWLCSPAPDSIFTSQGLFFSGTALVTFGGAYAVLAYVAQRAVEIYGWLSPGEMVRGLALAETTPGPLIMVVQFVAFLGAYHDPGPLNPWAAGRPRRAADHLGHLRPLLPVHLPRRPLRRTAARQRAASRRP